MSYNATADNFSPGTSQFGDGSDGDVIISANMSLTQDMCYNNLTINAGVTLLYNGWRIYVKNILTLNGTISGSGQSSLNDNAGAGGQVNGLGSVLSGQGGTSGSTTNATSPIARTFTAGGVGGNGGNNGANTGGIGGVNTDIAAINGGPQFYKAIPLYIALSYVMSSNTQKISGGSGGGGGAGNGTLAGTGGGGGGGVIGAFVRRIVSNTGGSIVCQGGNSGNATVTNRSTGGAGGGGHIYLATSYPIPANVTVSASGGVAGSIIGGTAVQGTNGTTGGFVQDISRRVA